MIFYLLLCTTLCLNSSVQKFELPISLLAYIASFNTQPSRINDTTIFGDDNRTENEAYLKQRHVQIGDFLNFASASRLWRLGAYQFAFNQFLIENELNLFKIVIGYYYKAQRTLGITKYLPVTIVETILCDKISIHGITYRFTAPTMKTNGFLTCDLPTEFLMSCHDKYTTSNNTIRYILLTQWCPISIAACQETDHTTKDNLCKAIGTYSNKNHDYCSLIRKAKLPQVHVGAIFNRGTAINKLIFRAMESFYNAEYSQKMKDCTEALNAVLTVSDVKKIALDYIDFLED